MAAFAATIAGVTAAWTALVHCDQSSTTETYTPITGVQISAASLTAGHGCSDDPADPNAVYRYSAVLSYVYEGGAVNPGFDSQYAGVFECFADGFFENVPVADGGAQAFSLVIAAWNVQGFPASLTPCIAEPDGSANPGNLCPAEQVANVLDGGGVPPQWTTTCTAFMQQNIPAVANCAPLVPFDAGSPASDAAGGDGALPPDASLPDASSEGAAPASDGAAPADAATPTDAVPASDAADAATGD